LMINEKKIKMRASAGDERYARAMMRDAAQRSVLMSRRAMRY